VKGAARLEGVYYHRLERQAVSSISNQSFFFIINTNHLILHREIYLYFSQIHTKFMFNPLTPELNPSAQRCLTRFFTADFASLTVNFVNICVKNQQIQQLFIQFINHVWYLLHVSALHCHPQGAFQVSSERCSIEKQSIEYCGWARCF
jgi:hypothetical protein